ncbi:MAG TPA: glycosyltransferase family 39 protein [Thermoanaerobaculia bacterium]|nr:glycosyltransferase family 39 protein [Thermoanaerobaculia bacterium]
MSRGATPLPPPSAEPDPRTPSLERPRELPGRREAPAWLEPAAAILILLGLAARLLVSSGSVLAKDESYHLQIAGSGGWMETYRNSLTTPHPPLFFFLLNLWKRVARTGWELRLLPIAFGVAFLWVSYLWSRRLVGRTAALSTLALTSLLPSLVLLTSEIRGYALLFLLEIGALAALERALDEGRARFVVAFAALEALALWTHYSAIFLICAALMYSAFRVRTRRPPPAFVAAWIVSQAALAGVFTFLVRTHITHLHGSLAELNAKEDWLQSSYFHRGAQGPLGFVARDTLALATYLFSARTAGAVALALGLVGAAGIVAQRPSAAVLLAAPFAACAVAGLLDLYPYGGTRHDMFLAPLACLAVAAGIGRLSGDRPWAPLALAAALLPAALAVAW